MKESDDHHRSRVPHHLFRVQGLEGHRESERARERESKSERENERTMEREG